jgi:hypothetical protein
MKREAIAIELIDRDIVLATKELGTLTLFGDTDGPVGQGYKIFEGDLKRLAKYLGIEIYPEVWHDEKGKRHEEHPGIYLYRLQDDVGDYAKIEAEIMPYGLDMSIYYTLEDPPVEMSYHGSYVILWVQNP